MELKEKVEKKQYEKPQIVHRQPLEGIAGACEASSPTNGKTQLPCTVTFS